jgi:protein-tyrosine phosphatase
MKNLKGKFQFKIKIPKNDSKEEEKNLSHINNNNNRSSISQITENIFTSGYLVAKDISFLLNNNFTHVINCSRGSSMESPNDESAMSNNYEKSPSIRYLPIFLRDDPGADLINCFFQTIDFIESDNEKNNKKILIHCIEGISRAPALIAGYLMWKQNISTSKAIELIKSKRKCVDINLGFIIQLQKWENYLFSSPQKMQIFKLNPNIRLLEEKEIENENYNEDNYLIRYNYKLYYINNNKAKDDNLINEINVCDNTLFVDKNSIMEFIKNVIKYDKLLLKNDTFCINEINKTNKISKTDDILKMIGNLENNSLNFINSV